MSDGEIAERSGQMPDIVNRLSAAEVVAISKCTDWKRIHIHDALAFAYGCRVDFFDAADMRRVDDYLRKKPTFRYLRASPEWESYYLPLLKLWLESYGNVTTGSEIYPPIRNVLTWLASELPYWEQVAAGRPPIVALDEPIV